MKYPLIFFGILCFAFSQVNAQKAPTDLFHDADGNTYHQIFLDFQATEIVEMSYSPDGTPVHGELSSDGFSIVIKNYPGDKSVKMKLHNAAGEVREVSKSKCYIDPVLLNL